MSSTTADSPPAIQAPELDTYWDGVDRSYLPARDPAPEGVEFFTDADEDVDPITYEVIRYALLNTNFEHGMLLQRLCVSPIVMATRDFQTSVLTERGEPMFLGPNVQYFSSSHQLTAQWILENRAEALGMEQGDQWLSNDVYVAAPHQQDTNIVAPVFVEGKLFCWVANSLHYVDVGGPNPGSFSMEAESIWQESPLIPPMALVEKGAIRPDVEDLFIRQSRLPTAVRMDVRAAISGNVMAREKILALVERYGAATVKSVMYRTLDAAESLFAERLEHIPDGRWSHRTYTEAAVPGDRNLYGYQINITKKGGYLHVDNAGTDPQAGSINITYAALSGAIYAAIDSAMGADLAGAYGGIHRRVKIEPISGLLNCCEHPGAVSPSGAFTTSMNLHTAGVAVAKMLSCGDEQAKELVIGPGTTHFYTFVSGGVDGDGNISVLGCTDGMMGAIAAGPDCDGLDCGGVYWIPDGIVYNVEELESFFPVLYLFRRYLPAGEDSAGKFRGGLGFEEAITPWNHTTTQISLYGGESASRGIGLAGANPSRTGYFRCRKDTDLLETLKGGRVPRTLDELPGTELSKQFKGPLLDADDDTIWAFCWPSAAGYGDPLLRDPEKVAEEVATGTFTPEGALEAYGVVLVDGAVDAGATRERRTELRTRRLGYAAKELEPHADGVAAVTDVLGVRDGRWICAGEDLGPVGQSPRRGASLVERPIREVGEKFASQDVEMADQITYREYLCPVTGYRIDTELLRTGDEPLDDMLLSSEEDDR